MKPSASSVWQLLDRAWVLLFPPKTSSLLLLILNWIVFSRRRWRSWVRTLFHPTAPFPPLVAQAQLQLQGGLLYSLLWQLGRCFCLHSCGSMGEQSHWTWPPYFLCKCQHYSFSGKYLPFGAELSCKLWYLCKGPYSRLPAVLYCGRKHWRTCGQKIWNTYQESQSGGCPTSHEPTDHAGHQSPKPLGTKCSGPVQDPAQRGNLQCIEPNGSIHCNGDEYCCNCALDQVARKQAQHSHG
jgi:hypothetical protein